MEGLGGPSTSLGDLFSMIPLVLGVGSFDIPVVDFIRDSVEGNDLLHKQSGDSGSKEAD